MKIINVWIFLEVFALLPYFDAQHMKQGATKLKWGLSYAWVFVDTSLFLCLLLTSWSVSCVFCGAVRRLKMKGMSAWSVRERACCSSCEEACFQQSELDLKDEAVEEEAPGPLLQRSADSRLSSVWLPGCCGSAERIIKVPLYSYRTYPFLCFVKPG